MAETYNGDPEHTQEILLFNENHYSELVLQTLNSTKTIKEKKTDLLSILGMPDNIINAVSDEAFLKIANEVTEAGYVKEYCKEDIYGNISYLSKSEFEAEIIKIKQEKIQTRVNDGNYNQTDSYFEKTIYWFKQTSPSNHFILLASFAWLTTPSIRGTDVFSLGASTGNIVSSDCGAVASFHAYERYGSIVINDEDVIDDMTSISVTHYGLRVFAYKYHWPNNYSYYDELHTLNSGSFTDFAVLITGTYYASGLLSYFSIGSTYGRSLVNGAIPTSVKGNGTTISIAPSSNYTNHKIITTIDK